MTPKYRVLQVLVLALALPMPTYQSSWLQLDQSMFFQYACPQLDISFCFYRSTWLQTDISPCACQPSYMSNNPLDFYFAWPRPFLTASGCFCLA